MSLSLNILRFPSLIVVASAIVIGCPRPVWPAQAAAGDAPFPMRVSANGRHLVDASGKPFLLHGDTAWSLLVQLTLEEAAEYLENRRQKGFNTILVNLIEYYFADNPPNETYTAIAGSPFPNSGSSDFAAPGNNGTGTNHWVLVLETKLRP